MTLYFAKQIFPVDRPPIQDGFLQVEDGRIVALGAVRELPESEREGFDPNTTTVITPGLVNTHTHLDQSFGQTVPPSDSMADWLAAVVAKNRAAASMSERLGRCRDGVEELLASGTTCVNDISAHGSAVYVLAEAGLRGMVSLEVIHPASDSLALTGLLARFEALSANLPPLLQLGISPHSPYNVSPQAWRTLLEAFPQAPFHSHIAESREEVRYFLGEASQIDELHRRFLDRTFLPAPVGVSPVAYLAQNGLLNARTILAHGIFTSDEDRQALQAAGTTLSHCPRSNLFLHGQTLDGAAWQASGVAMGLGTDGHLSTENLDIRAEARAAMAAHGLDAATALRLMTLDGARALRLDAEIGSLTPGKAADFVLWQPDGATSPTQGNASAEAQIFSARAEEVYVAGELIYKPGDT